MTNASVLVIRKDNRFSLLLRKAGFSVANLELIRTEPIEDLTELDIAIANLGGYHGLFFTSPASATVFVDRLAASGVSIRPKAYVLGDRAKTIIEKAGFEVANDGTENTAEAMMRSFDESEFAHKKLLFVRGSKTVGTISRLLSPKARIDEVVVYRTVPVTPDDSELESTRERLGRAEIDWICFFSPSGVERFQELFEIGDTGGLSVAAIGDTTAAQAEKASLRVRFISRKANAEDFAAGLIKYIKRIA